jgi:YD repeat-containing protein
LKQELAWEWRRDRYREAEATFREVSAEMRVIETSRLGRPEPRSSRQRRRVQSVAVVAFDSQVVVAVIRQPVILAFLLCSSAFADAVDGAASPPAEPAGPYQSNLIYAGRPGVLKADPVAACRLEIQQTSYVPHTAEAVVEYFSEPVAGGYVSRYYKCSGRYPGWLGDTTKLVAWMYGACPDANGAWNVTTYPYGVCSSRPKKDVAGGSGSMLWLSLSTQHETDFARDAKSGLAFERVYRSAGSSRSSRLGSHWTDNYDRAVDTGKATTDGYVSVARGVDEPLRFSVAADKLTSDVPAAGVLSRLIDSAGRLTGWKYVSPSQETELYDAKGRLLSIAAAGQGMQTLSYDDSGRLLAVTDSLGRTLTFGYAANDLLAEVKHSSGRVVQYEFDDEAVLKVVAPTDQSARAYVYEEPARESRTPSRSR